MISRQQISKAVNVAMVIDHALACIVLAIAIHTASTEGWGEATWWFVGGGLGLILARLKLAKRVEGYFGDMVARQVHAQAHITRPGNRK